MMQSRNTVFSSANRMTTNDVKCCDERVALPVTERTRTSGPIHFERVVGS
jgi:hypothetical protein